MGSSAIQSLVIQYLMKIMFKKDIDLKYYIFTKTQKLIDYGTQKVIWIFTKGKKIMVAEGKEWHIYDFDKTIQVIDNVEFNLEEFFKEEKINL